MYSHPPYIGHRIHSRTFRVGESIGEIYEFATSADDMYVAGRTAEGWVNLWCAKNNKGQYGGIYFVDIKGHKCLAPYNPPEAPEDYFGPRGKHRKGDKSAAMPE